MNTNTMPHPELQAPEAGKVVEHKIPGEKLVARVRELLREGNVRRLIVKNEAGAVLMEIPLTVGVVGAVLMPVWVALGAIAALAAHYRIAVEHAPVDRHAAEPPQIEPYVFHSRDDV